MEMINEKKAKLIFDDFNEKFNSYITYTYRLDRENVDIKIYNNLKLADLAKIAKFVASVLIETEESTTYIKDAVLASVLIDNITDLPLPKIVSENEDDEEEESIDYSMCYAILFGNDGLVRGISDQHFKRMIQTLSVNIDKLMDAHYKDTKVEQLADKLINIIDIAERQISDINENPAATLDFLKGLNIPTGE